MKKTLSVILIIATLVSCFSVAAFSAPQNNASLIVVATPGKNSYGYSDEATLKVSITNPTETTAAGVSLNIKTNEYYLLSGGTAVPSEIKSGETVNLSLKLALTESADGLGFIQRIILFIVNLFRSKESFQSKDATSYAYAVAEINQGGKQRQVTVTVGCSLQEKLPNTSDVVYTYQELLPAARKNRKTYDSYINVVLDLVNEMRREAGAEPLALSEKLTEQACVRAEEIARSGIFDHIRPDGTSFSTIFRENGFMYGTVGENIAWGYTTAESVCAAWKESRGHYENIIRPEYKSIGIGIAIDSDGRPVWVQHFYSEGVD